MGKVITLHMQEEVAGRPFTHPVNITQDVITLRFMVDQLCLFMESLESLDQHPRPVVVHQPSRKNWIYRLIIARPERLLQPGTLTFVGFLGDRRHEVDVSLADEFDRTLVAEIPTYPALLSYCSLALISGNFSNLVIFSDPAGKAHWSQGMAHAQAAQKLAPHFYNSVKLYNGTLPVGIGHSRDLQLECVKYFEYGAGTPWRAVRDLSNWKPS